MLWPVTSSAICWARMPRSVVSRPMKVETLISDPHVDDVGGLGGRRRPQWGVSGLLCAREHAHQVIEKCKLLPDQDPVLRVDARDFGKQAAKLCRLLPCAIGIELGKLRQERFQGQLVGGHAQPRGGVPKQRVAL